MKRVQRRARALEAFGLVAILVAQAVLFALPIHSSANYDEGVYLASAAALNHGQTLGSDVFAPQFPGFYDLLRVITALGADSVAAVRADLIALMLLGTLGAWMVGRRFGGWFGGLLTAALLVIAPPLDLFGFQVIADTPTVALTILALGIATLGGPVAAVTAGAIFAAALSVKLTAVTALPALVWLLRRRLVAALAGAASVGLVLVGLHATALTDLWASAVEYHEKARSTPNVIAHPHREIFRQIPLRTPFFWLAVAAVVVAGARLAARRPLHVWALWTWPALAVAFLLWHGPLHYNHLILFPAALAVAAGATLGAALPRRPEVCAVAALIVVAAYVQQVRRVDASRPPEPPSNVAAAHALTRLVPPDALVIDDRPIISYRADRRVVGELVDTAFLRFETRSLTDAKVIRQLPRADAVVISRSLRTRPRVLAAVRERFRLRYDRGGVRIFVRR